MSDHDRRMSDTESMMWRLEKDPHLASAFANITLLDRTPDMDVLCARMERTAILFPRLRRRVQPAPGNVGNPTWVDDPEFDIRRHIRRISLPSPGSMRQLEDLVALLLADPFDRARPLWQFVVVDGLAGGRSALIEKLHHTIADGQGGVELSLHFLDLEREPPALPPLDPDLIAAAETAPSPDAAEALRGAMTDSLRIPIALLRQVRDVLADPSLATSLGQGMSATVRSLRTQLLEADGARSPLWVERSLRRRILTTSAPYAEVREASRALGGRINTGFVTAVAHAAGAYHARLGAPVESLRASMAVSTRTEASGANAFTLVRLLVPTGEMEMGERFAAVEEAAEAARTRDMQGSLDAIAGLASFLPTSVVTRIARAQAETVDFATSNVRGAGVPLYIAGALMLSNHPVGPLAGVAMNITLMSYMGNLDMGIHVDEAAVREPELLRECIDEAFTELCAHAPSGAQATQDAAIKKRWWRRRRPQG